MICRNNWYYIERNRNHLIILVEFNELFRSISYYDFNTAMSLIEVIKDSLYSLNRVYDCNANYISNDEILEFDLLHVSRMNMFSNKSNLNNERIITV